MKPERLSTMKENGAPPLAAAALYPGEVMHARLRPFFHRFSYGVFSMLVDVDRLSAADQSTFLFSVNKANLVSLREGDHVSSPGETMRGFVDRLLANAGIERAPARILLLAYPRILGYAFNPISVFFAYDNEENLVALIYSVRNTFGERHFYVAPIAPGEIGPSGVRQSRDKRLHVSPFIGMRARYHFRIMPPGKTVRLRIHETEEAVPVLEATFKGRHQELTTRTLLSCLAAFPFMTFKVMAMIHWQALKLWIRGAKFRTSPPPQALASYGDGKDARHAGALAGPPAGACSARDSG